MVKTVNGKNAGRILLKDTKRLAAVCSSLDQRRNTPLYLPEPLSKFLIFLPGRRTLHGWDHALTIISSRLKLPGKIATGLHRIPRLRVSV